ncbi:DsbA family protein [Rhodobacteraceae bacterium NNCM2]|nr:DsbA family protein [Coraliihabitans acroporae]
MDNQLEIYVTLRSPYSYLASARIVDLARETTAAVRFRPVYPIAIRKPDFFEKSDPMWLAYLIRDTKRVAEMEGIPFRFPSPDPIVQDLETSRIAPEQPYIRRLTRLTVAAEERGAGLAFYAELSRAIFGDMGKWNEGTLMAEAAGRAGLDLAELDAAIEAEPEHYEAVILANEEAQRAAGHWGTPLLVFDGEPFFGQDRVAMCRWRMQQKGALAQ